MKSYALALLCLFAFDLQANLGGGTVPEVNVLPELTSAGPNNFRKVFQERRNYELSEPLQIEHAPVLYEGTLCEGPLVYLRDELLPGVSQKPIVVPAGTKINSYYIYVDPQVFSIPNIDWTIFLESSQSAACADFDQNRESSLLGYIYTATGLDATDYLGMPNSLYPRNNPARGLEVGDVISATAYADITEIITNFDVSDPYDAIRVIEIAAPEVPNVMLPISKWALVVLGALLTFLRIQSIQPIEQARSRFALQRRSSAR